MLRSMRAFTVACVAIASMPGAGWAQMHPAPYGGGGDPVVFLDQSWSDQERLEYYFTSQGSAALRYEILLGLEKPNSEELFRTNANLARYGFVPIGADATYNPDGLPIGIARARVTSGRWQGEWAGLTCAACHNGQVQYRGASVRIAGGNNHTLDLIAFVEALDDALQATATDSAKFNRLAARLGRTEATRREELRRWLDDDAASVRVYRTRTSLSPYPAGPGRVDALGLIHNQVLGTNMGFPENWSAPLAPAKYSFVWNIPQSAWAQWTGTLPDPVLRNGGESIGVFVRFDFSSRSEAEGLFESTIDFPGQIRIEELLRRLAPPAWPEGVFGPIDRTRAEAGKTLFAANCASCHSTWPHRWGEPRQAGQRFIENAIVRQTVVGTDPVQLRSPQLLSDPEFRTGAFAQFLAPPLTGRPLATNGDIFAAIRTEFFPRMLDRLNLTPEQRLSAHGYGAVPPAPAPPLPAFLAYKANPAEGMWANAPFLHNGSVPNLYELLSPVSERSRQFYVGGEFDPVRVGFSTTSGRFRFDTTLLGNSNAGHAFQDGSEPGTIGRRLFEDERWALVEYMKTLPERPAQVAPFGGPAQPVRAWADPTFYHVRNPGTFAGAPNLAAASSVETTEPGEQEAIETVRRITLERLRQQFPANVRPVLRDAHPKTHGLATAEFIVLDGLPEALRHGVFRTPRRFDALMRFSAGGVEVLPDTTAQAAGLGIKLLGVEGESLLPSEPNARTQDFVMINFPTFFIRSMQDYVELHRYLDSGDMTPFFRTRPVEAAAVQAMRGTGMQNPLGARYFSQTPYRLGPNVVKFSVRAVSAVDNTPPTNPGPNFLREAMARQASAGDVYLEFLVQVQADPVSMPIEDSVVLWDEEKAPFQRVALIRIPQQQVASAERLALAERLSFTPWRSLPEHRPLGSINRSRLTIYELIAEFRRTTNGVSTEEPARLPE